MIFYPFNISSEALVNKSKNEPCECQQWQESVRGHWTKVTEKNARKGASSDGFEKQTETIWTWRGAAGRSRCGQRRQQKLGRRQSTAVYGGPAVVLSAPIVGGFWSRDRRAGGVHRPDTSVQFRAYIYMQERPTRTESALELSANEADEGAEWCDPNWTMKTPATRRSSSCVLNKQMR